MGNLMKAPLFLGLLLASAILLKAAEKPLQFYVIDVDHGNAVLVVSPEGKSMLLDSGPIGTRYTKRILAAMKDAGVKQIDYAVTSHYHWDHFSTLPELAQSAPILNFVDHGTNVEWHRTPEFYKLHGGGPTTPFYEAYLKLREKSNHIVAKPGDKIPFGDVDVTVVSSAGQVLSAPLPGAGGANPAKDETQPKSDDELEDAQSVGVVIQFGKFRFANLGDLTWNTSMRLFMPE